MSELPAIPESPHLLKVCRIGQLEKTCRYAVVGVKFECAKGSELSATIDGRVSSMHAKGDNCSGPPDFEANKIPA